MAVLLMARERGTVDESTRAPPRDRRDDWSDVRAHDCTRPSQVEAVRLPPQGDCPKPDAEITRSKGSPAFPCIAVSISTSRGWGTECKWRNPPGSQWTIA